MSQTPYHARYFAHELTKRSSSASIDSLTAALADLNPHQVEAAMFLEDNFGLSRRSANRRQPGSVAIPKLCLG
jgi:hypothetical protein